MANTYDVTQVSGRVRLLLNDVSAPWVFSDEEINAFLELEGQNVKRAAAQAIDTNADNEALASKVLTDTDGKATDGAKLADALRKRAATLRAQADREVDLSDDGAFFEMVPPPRTHQRRPELTDWPYQPPGDLDWPYCP